MIIPTDSLQLYLVYLIELVLKSRIPFKVTYAGGLRLEKMITKIVIFEKK